MDAVVKHTVQYGTAVVDAHTAPRERALWMDIYLPDAMPSAPPRPALVLAFGGAFHRGSRSADAFEVDGRINTAIAAYCATFAARGYVCMSIDYRLVIEDPRPGDTPVLGDRGAVPRSRTDQVRVQLGLAPATADQICDGIEAAADDMAAALRFVERNATQWDVDPRRIVAGGWSAGARTALNAVFGEGAPACGVIALSGHLAAGDLARHLQRRPDRPAVLLVWGESDLDYVRACAEPLRAQLAQAGCAVTAHCLPGATHFYPASTPLVHGGVATVDSAIDAFLATQFPDFAPRGAGLVPAGVTRAVA